MQLSLRWLKELLPHHLSTSELTEVLTNLGIEVDAVVELPMLFSGVVAGKLLGVAPHPNAERLLVVSITDGHETHQVVCGDTTCQPGEMVAFAKIGAVLHSEEAADIKIKKGKLRGIESYGMLCSAKELGLGSNNSGVMRLSKEVVEGTDLAAYYGDTLLHLSLTPNLSYCAHTVGIARELSAALQVPLSLPCHEVIGKSSLDEHLSIELLEPQKCPRFACCLIENVQIGPSPAWLQQRLLASGTRSINNVVDITNYVRLEMGHPLHAFDYDKLSGSRLSIGHAKEGDLLTTLDGQKQVLSADMLVVSDTKGPVALAGIMGEQNSEVDATTKNILLEAAYFEPTQIRRTAKKLGISSESAKRFEKGADPNAAPVALHRAASLLLQIIPGATVRGSIDQAAHTFEPLIVICRLSRLHKVLGMALPLSEVLSLFSRLGFPHTSTDGEHLHIHVPTYRTDITGEIDLIEEIARLYGYNHLPRPKVHATLSTLPCSPLYSFERCVRQQLLGLGLREFLTCDLISQALLEESSGYGFAGQSPVAILNPSSQEQGVLRTSLLPGMLKAFAYNDNYRYRNLQAFEVGRVHFLHGGQYREQSMLGLCLTGIQSPHHWGTKDKELDFYDLKGLLEGLLLSLHINRAIFTPSSFPNLHPGRQAILTLDALTIGVLGELHPSLVASKGLSTRVFFAELNLNDLFHVHKKERRMKPLPPYPGSERDWTVTLPTKMPVDVLLSDAVTGASALLRYVDILDVYTSDKLGPDTKNVTLRFAYQDLTKTLSFEMVEKEHAKVIDAITKKIEEHMV